MDLAGGARVSEREVEAQLQAAAERASEPRSSHRSQREAEASDRRRSLEADLLPPADELGDLSEGAVAGVCEHVADAEPELENATLAIVAALTSTIASFLLGFTLGFTSPAQVDLEAHGDTPCAQSNLGLCLNTAQFSFYSGTVNVAALIGDLIIPPVTDYFGRRTALQASAIPLATGWFVQSISNEYSQLLIGRILTGFGIGASSPVVPLYISEIAPQRLRGGVGALHQGMITCGTLFVFILGMHELNIHWNHIALVGSIPPVLMLVMLFAMPESPTWLMASSDASRGAARNALMFLRQSAKVDNELERIRQDVLGDISEGRQSATKPRLRDLSMRDARPGMTVACLSLICMQACGVAPLVFFSHEIVAGAGAGNADKVTIYVAVMQVASTAACIGFSDKIGRKPLLIASCIGIAVCNLMLAACYSEIGTKVFGAHKGLVASVTVNGLISSFGMGVGTIPWLLMAEILPSRVRGLGSSFATALNWLVAFMVTTSFGPLCSLIGTAKVYLLVFTPVILAFAGFVAVCVPETTGRSLDEIQCMLYERLGPQ